MEMTSYDHGVPSWVDLGTPDTAGAAAFYGGLFGWDCQEGPPEAGGYHMCMLRGQPVAGMGPPMMPDAPTTWLAYISVNDANAVADKVRELGGTVLVDPMDVMGFGTTAVLTDPTGAVFAVWQAGTHPGAGLIYEPGTLGWIELVTSDVEAVTAFYPALFGWKPDTQGTNTSGPYTQWQLDGRPVAGMMPKPDDMPDDVPSFWMVYFVVEDTDATAERVTELGGSVIVSPRDIEPGRFAVVADPFDAPFSIIAMRPTAPTAPTDRT